MLKVPTKETNQSERGLRRKEDLLGGEKTI